MCLLSPASALCLPDDDPYMLRLSCTSQTWLVAQRAHRTTEDGGWAAAPTPPRTRARTAVLLPKNALPKAKLGMLWRSNRGLEAARVTMRCVRGAAGVASWGRRPTHEGAKHDCRGA